MRNREIIKKAFIASIPVMAGYLVLAAGFGILMSTHGFQVIHAFFMSLFIYAGSLQYVAVQLLSDHAALATIGVTALLVNMRHVFYGISLIDRYKGAGWRKWYLMFALTDETYSLIVADQEKGQDHHLYYFYISLLNHIYWLVGTIVGVIIGKMISFDTQGIDFVLTALFVTIVVDQIRVSRQINLLLIGLVVPVICLLIFGASHFLIPSLFALVIILLIFKERIAYDGEDCL